MVPSLIHCLFRHCFFRILIPRLFLPSNTDCTRTRSCLNLTAPFPVYISALTFSWLSPSSSKPIFAPFAFCSNLPHCCPILRKLNYITVWPMQTIIMTLSTFPSLWKRRATFVSNRYVLSMLLTKSPHMLSKPRNVSNITHLTIFTRNFVFLPFLTGWEVVSSEGHSSATKCHVRSGRNGARRSVPYRYSYEE